MLRMAEDKSLLKKDLMLILKLNSKLHYDDITEVKKVHNVIKQKNMFETSVGQRYIRRLEQIIQGESTDKCLFCGKNGASNSVMCLDCLAKLQPSRAAKTSEAAEITPETKTSETAETTDVTNTSAMSKKENVAQEPKKTDNRKNIIIGSVIVVMVLAVLVAIGLDKIFGALMFISFGVLVYKCIKKKPKKGAVIAFVAFLMLFAVFSEDTGSVSSYGEFEEFVRDNENIGETITFRAEVVSVFADKYLIQVREKNTTNLIQIITTTVPGMNLFHGDEIIYTGIYNGRTTDGNRLAFVTVAIELD